MAVTKIYLDIREEEELLDKKLVPLTDSVQVINIPTRSVFANVDWIKKLEILVIIICRSSKRSKMVKETYFKDDPQIFYFDGELEMVELEGDVQIEKGKGGYGLQQYRNIMFILILILISSLCILRVNKNVILTVTLLIIGSILYQTINKTCFLGQFIPLPK